jgi:hypothetical protein
MSTGERRRIADVRIGDAFGRLTVLSIIAMTRRFRCRCTCGIITTPFSVAVLDGKTRSCGCLRRELTAAAGRARVAHGHTANGVISATYNSWSAMQARCSATSGPYFVKYGARGISICRRWRSFAAFLKDMGERPPDKTLDRIDNDGNYEPGNCRWATKSEQARNRRSTRLLEFRGALRPLIEVAEMIGITDNALRLRLYRGLSVEEATSKETA